MYSVVGPTQFVQLAEMAEGNSSMGSNPTGSQRRGSEVMMAVNGNQGTFEPPVYMVQNGIPAQQPPSAGFLQHRRSIAADPQQQQQPQAQSGQHYQSIQQTDLSTNHNIEVVQQPQQVSQYKVPNPIMIGPSFTQPQPVVHNYSYRINPSPTYMPQPSPTQQISPYYMMQQSSNDVGQNLSSVPNHGQPQYVIAQSDTGTTVQQQVQLQPQQQQQQLSLSLDQSQMRSQHVETPQTVTPLTSTFLHYMPFQSESPATGKTDQSQRFYLQQQQPGQQQQFPVMHQQQQVSPLSRGHGLQTHGSEPRMQTQYSLPRTNSGQEFTYAVRRESSPAVVYPYQQSQLNSIQNNQNMIPPSQSMHHDSARPTNPHPPDPGIGSNSGPFSASVLKQLPVANSSGYTTMHPSARDLPSYAEGSRPTWSPYQQRMMGSQNASAHANFPASYFGNPALHGGVTMFTDDNEEEEYTSTVVFDPYIVSICKRGHIWMTRNVRGKRANALVLLP